MIVRPEFDTKYTIGQRIVIIAMAVAFIAFVWMLGGCQVDSGRPGPLIVLHKYYSEPEGVCKYSYTCDINICGGHWFEDSCSFYSVGDTLK